MGAEPVWIAPSPPAPRFLVVERIPVNWFPCHFSWRVGRGKNVSRRQSSLRQDFVDLLLRRLNGLTLHFNKPVADRGRVTQTTPLVIAVSNPCSFSWLK